MQVKDCKIGDVINCFPRFNVPLRLVSSPTDCVPFLLPCVHVSLIFRNAPISKQVNHPNEDVPQYGVASLDVRMGQWDDECVLLESSER